MSRRSLLWLLILPLAVVASQLGHAVAYRLVTPDETERAHELAATGHAYLTYAPMALAICGVLVVLALASEFVNALTPRRTARPSLLPFAVLAPAIFASQEHIERLLQDGVFPWSAALDATFLVGLLLQLPFAALAYFLARLMLGVVRSIRRRLSNPPPRPRALEAPVSRFTLHVARPRVGILALGYGSRGPPLAR